MTYSRKIFLKKYLKSSILRPYTLRCLLFGKFPEEKINYVSRNGVFCIYKLKHVNYSRNYKLFYSPNFPKIKKYFGAE